MKDDFIQLKEEMALLAKAYRKAEKAFEEVNEFFSPNIIGVAGLINFSFHTEREPMTLHLYGDEVFSALIKHGVILQAVEIESVLDFHRFTAELFGYRVYFLSSDKNEIKALKESW